MTLNEIIFSMLVTVAALSARIGLAEALRCAVSFMLGLVQGLAS